MDILRLLLPLLPFIFIGPGLVDRYNLPSFLLFQLPMVDYRAFFLLFLRVNYFLTMIGFLLLALKDVFRLPLLVKGRVLLCPTVEAIMVLTLGSWSYSFFPPMVVVRPTVNLKGISSLPILLIGRIAASLPDQRTFATDSLIEAY
ncbi:hypothetical protein Salmi_Mp033 (mitochondrion) [Salvia miltiorrhiza]|uniref:Uncharacterized protein n=1 Tax=Salvia miltiorrhiza TaxID=226208 RepID=V9P4X4_SALMI|nr:hypothetical protein Salmi_Mp033 [Salvia miltiorrhiza]AGU16566.1 hypothetical protein Salmi_Mp033 [Salvia miltiorrhiza]